LNFNRFAFPAVPKEHFTMNRFLNGTVAVLAAGAAEAATLTPLTNSVIDSAALTLTDTVTFGKRANGLAYTQELLVTHSNRQYAAYYNENRHVCVARRTLPDGVWAINELVDYTMMSTDSHNVVSIGLAPLDGTIHLAFDHHVDELHYRKTVPGALFSNAWNAALFGPVTNELVAGEPLTITYPRFETTPAGNLIFCYRKGYPTHGDRMMHRYDATAGTWDSPIEFVSSEGTHTDTYGTNTSRSGYLNPIRYGKDGRLHATWVWRAPSVADEPGSNDNHDLMYLYSDDNGQTWHTGDGTPVSDGGRVDTPGITAVSIPRGYGMNNSSAMTVDGQGHVHVVCRHCTDESLAAAGSYPGEVAFGVTAARRLHHYWRDTNNTWHHNELPGNTGSRSAALVADRYGNLLFARQISDTLEILRARSEAQWTNWQVIHTQSIDNSTETLTDTLRWKQDSVFSVTYQETPSAWGKPSALHVVEFNYTEDTLPDMYQHQVEVSADAYVRNNGTQDGTGTSLFVKNITNDEFDRITYLRFDTRKISAPVFSATLRLHANTVSGPVTASLFEVDDNSWTETDITWANAPALGNKISGALITTNSTWVEWDLTQFLITHTNRIISLALWVEDPTNENLTLRSREYGDGSYSPELTIQSASPYAHWAGDNPPGDDANNDGIPNLLAFAAGAASPTNALTEELITIDGTRTGIRRAAVAEAYARIEQRNSLTTGIWETVTGTIDTNHYAPGIDRFSVLSTNPAAFFRYAVDP
jgi:hypothetical protein